MNSIAKIQVDSSVQAYSTFSVFPADLNYVGTLFGGKLLAEMDIVAAKLAHKILRQSPYCNEAVTVSVANVDFSKPGYLGDNIDLIAGILKLGNSSMDIEVVVERENKEGEKEIICEAQFRFVALQNKKAYPHGLVLVQTEQKAS